MISHFPATGKTWYKGKMVERSEIQRHSMPRKWVLLGITRKTT
jgi:hypothetical protein